MQIRLPVAKLEKLIELVEWWLWRVMRPGYCCLRRLFKLIAVDRFTQLHKAFRADLQWWRTLLSNWNEN